MTGMLLVYRYRVKSLNGLLNQQSRAVNYVWNFCNDTQKHALKWGKKWPTGFDMNVLTTGSSKELRIHSGTVNAVCEQYAKSRSQHRRPYLRYRGRKSLGWVPLKGISSARATPSALPATRFACSAPAPFPTARSRTGRISPAMREATGS
ncbi:transposase (fragment) [Cupriavidus necator]|uniref:Transposase n=1 Tax=Cupriavidus necator TaxID=106590 RepID=A0A1K0IJY2_CUPNE